MNVFEAFETDADLVENGLWLDINTPQGERVMRIKIRPADMDLNPEYRRAVADAAREQQLKIGSVDEDEVLVRAMSEHVLVDWEGAKDRNGDDIEFSGENAADLLRRLPKLRSAIHRNASQYSRFLKDYTDDAAGNS